MGNPGSRVYVVNVGNHDYTKAHSFGEIVPLTEGRPNIFATDNLFQKIADGLTEATANDYLLLSGNIIPNAMAVHILLTRHGKVNTLVWINNADAYKVITITRST